MPKITVDYLVPVCVHVDTDTGKVEEVWFHGDGFNVVKPDQVFYGGEDDNIPEYLPEEHPLWEKATELASSIHLTVQETKLGFARSES